MRSEGCIYKSHIKTVVEITEAPERVHLTLKREATLPSASKGSLRRLCRFRWPECISSLSTRRSKRLPETASTKPLAQPFVKRTSCCFRHPRHRRDSDRRSIRLREGRRRQGDHSDPGAPIRQIDIGYHSGRSQRRLLVGRQHDRRRRPHVERCRGQNTQKADFG